MMYSYLIIVPLRMQIHWNLQNQTKQFYSATVNEVKHYHDNEILWQTFPHFWPTIINCMERLPTYYWHFAQGIHWSMVVPGTNDQ